MIRFRPFIQELVVFFHFSSLRSNLHIPQCVCVRVRARNHIKSLLRVALIMSLLTHSHSKKKHQKKYFGWFQAHLYWFNHIVNLLFFKSFIDIYELQVTRDFPARV